MYNNKIANSLPESNTHNNLRNTPKTHNTRVIHIEGRMTHVMICFFLLIFDLDMNHIYCK